MKGKLYILIPLICAVMCIFGSFVSAKEIDKDNVPNNTYIIGNHMFTDKTTLSTKHIMLGATTIESDKLSDMVIYYKTPWGVWWDGLSGEDIQVPEKFEVDYEDTEQFLLNPTLSNVMGGSSEENVLWARMSVNFEGNYGPQEMWSAIDGYELYTKNNGEYTLVNTVEGTTYTRVEVNLGESKTYVARVYVLDANGQKVYSDYSNEVVLDNTKLLTPTLKNLYADRVPNYVGYEDGVYFYDLAIESEDYKYTEGEGYIAVGYDLFEKNGTEYIDGTEVQIAGIIRVPVEAGTSKTFVAKSYTLNSKGEKIYSEYSNELVIDNTKIATPTLKNVGASDSQEHVIYENGVYFYDLAIESEDYKYTEGEGYIAVGYDLFEKNGTEYIDGTEVQIAGIIRVPVEAGTRKTFVAKAYVLNSKGEKIYSDYSNEIVIDNTRPLVPTLSDVMAGLSEGNALWARMDISFEGNYGREEIRSTVDGYELYTKNNGEYTLVNTVEGTTYTRVEVNLGESKTYVARVYVLDENGQKVYSDYSNEVVLDNTVKAPILDNIYADRAPDYADYVGYENGMYLYDLFIQDGRRL